MYKVTFQETLLNFNRILDLKVRYGSNKNIIDEILYCLLLNPQQEERIRVLQWEKYTEAARKETVIFFDKVKQYIAQDRDNLITVSCSFYKWNISDFKTNTENLGRGLGFLWLSAGFRSDFVSCKSNSLNWYRRGCKITVRVVVPLILEKTPEKN